MSGTSGKINPRAFLMVLSLTWIEKDSEKYKGK